MTRGGWTRVINVPPTAAFIANAAAVNEVTAYQIPTHLKWAIFLKEQEKNAHMRMDLVDRDQ